MPYQPEITVTPPQIYPEVSLQSQGYPYTTWGQILGAPYITVSSKGIANGLSVYKNDGAIFGPDTLGTETSGITEACSYAGSSGSSVELLSGKFAINATITISNGITIHGQGVFSYPTFNQYPPGDTSSAPYIYPSGTVIVNNTTGDAIDITASYESVNLDGFGILMTQAGGTGIKCSPPDPATQIGMVYSHWGTVIVYNEVGDGSNYAFWFDNFGNNTFDNLQSEGMLMMHINSLSDADTGNSTFTFVFGQPPSANTDNALKIESTGTNDQITDYIHFVYLQIQVGNPTHHSIYIGTNVYFVKISFTDLETSGTSSLVLNNNGILYIEYLSAYNGGTFENSGNLRINTAAFGAEGSVFNNTSLLFIPHGLGTGSTTINNTGYAKIGVDPRYYSFGNLPQASIPTNPPVSGNTYDNNNPYDIRLKIPVTYNPTTTEAATLATGIVPTGDTMVTSTKVSIPAGITAGQILTYEMIVPTGYSFQLVATNATIGTVEVEPVYN